jgi:cysteine synthase
LPITAKSAIEVIGNTPLVALQRVHPGSGKIFGKAEYLQPGGSVKDRAALAIIDDCLSSGRLKPGQAVVAMTSGNFGAGLALVCGILGHPLIVTMSAGNSPNRARMIRDLGAELVLVPQIDGEPGAVTGADLQAATDAAIQLSRERGAIFLDQFVESGSVRAHEQGTAPEIWNQLDGMIDAFVACVGSGGTFVGVSRFLRGRDPKIICAAVEPEGIEVLAGRPIRRSRHILQGTGYGSLPQLWDSGLMSLSIAVSDKEASEWKAFLARCEGLHVGYSSGANVCAAVKLMKSGFLRRDARVVTILCDTGLKY